MNVLIVGSGGREHALAWAIKRSPDADHVYVAPGNGGTAAMAENTAVDVGDMDSVIGFVRDNGIDLTVVGPEAPLVAGMVDRFREAGLRCFGPTQAAARLEGSKVFAKEFMRKHGIPTADYLVFDDPAAAKKHVEDLGLPVVVKADGLAQGKGVVVAGSREEAEAAIEEIMVGKKFGEAGRQVIIEQCLEGEEVSVHSICSGGEAVLFPTSQDHKRVFDDDRGPNTGGMGAYAPVPFVTPSERDEIYETIVLRTLRGMEKDGHEFTGVLYAGLMVTDSGPKVLEFNVRFGDPETQVLLPLLETDLLYALYESAEGRPAGRVDFHEDRSAVTVVVAAEGYPGSYAKGATIDGLDLVETPQRVVFHAGTRRTSRGLVTAGGRVVAVTAWDDDLERARENAYDGVMKVGFDGAFWRSDIGENAL